MTHSVTFDDKLTETGERKRLRTALEVVTRGSIADTLLSHANEYLLNLRKLGDSDAAGLVVCVDCDHADHVAGFMTTNVLGRRPVVACSRLHDPSDAAPADAIRGFRAGHDPWLVAVNMVSEGVDSRRLRAVVYLTNRLTLLSFRQIVGRVVRTDPTNIDDHGRVYIPADPSLLRMSLAITKAVKLLPPPMSITTDKRPAGRVAVIDEGGGRLDEFLAIASAGEAGGASDTFGREAGHDLIRLAEAYVLLKKLTSTDPASLALAASENADMLEAMRREVDGG